MNGDELEKQVKDILQKDGWQVLAPVYYTDPSTQKPREKDIVAIKSQFPNEDILSYNARLFIECKYFPEATEIYSKGGKMGKFIRTVRADGSNVFVCLNVGLRTISGILIIFWLKIVYSRSCFRIYK